MDRNRRVQDTVAERFPGIALVGTAAIRGIALSFCLSWQFFCRAETAVVYPAPESSVDVRYNDLVEILNAALARTVATHGTYKLSPAAIPMNESRLQIALQEGKSVNVLWSSTSTLKEALFRTVRIPLRKGLLGYRIALIAKSRQLQVDRAVSAADLRRLVVGQGLGWGDAAVYEANGITVMTAGYDSLFRMTVLGRFDLFPRGVGEVFAEYALRSESLPDLAVERNLLIYYPWPYYFFFNRKDGPLADRIETGLRIMMKDGSFDAIFWKYNGEAIEKADFKGRRIIRLENPILPEATPLDEDSLWFDPLKDIPGAPKPRN